MSPMVLPGDMKSMKKLTSLRLNCQFRQAFVAGNRPRPNIQPHTGAGQLQLKLKLGPGIGI